MVGIFNNCPKLPVNFPEQLPVHIDKELSIDMAINFTIGYQ